MAAHTSRVLVIGAPRSGTTWVAEVLGATPHTKLIHEPDNPDPNPQAWRARELHGWYPVLRSGERYIDYERIWDLAFAGGWPTSSPAVAAGHILRRLPPPMRHLLLVGLGAMTRRVGRHSTNLVVKSVHAAFCVEWLIDRYSPRIILVQRNPLSVIASWIALDMPVGDLATNRRVRADYIDRWGLPSVDEWAPKLDQIAWSVGLLMTVLQRQAQSHPEWIVVRHEDLCIDPTRELRLLAGQVGLEWSENAERRLLASQVQGSGYETRRVARELPDKWRERYKPGQIPAVMTILAGFPDLRLFLPSESEESA